MLDPKQAARLLLCTLLSWTPGCDSSDGMSGSEGVSSVSDSSARQQVKPVTVDRAAEQVRRQVEWFGENPSRFRREFIAGLAAMNFARSRIAPINYAVKMKRNERLPVHLEECLVEQAGICGSQNQLFRELLGRLEVETRDVGFYLHGVQRAQNDSHVATEVFWDGQWHLFDVTWGTFYRRPGGAPDEVLSTQEVLVLEDIDPAAVAAASDLWYQQWTAAGLDARIHLRGGDSVDVVIGGEGRVRVRPKEGIGTSRLVYEPLAQPNWIGRINGPPNDGLLALRLLLPDGLNQLVGLRLDLIKPIVAGILSIETSSGRRERRVEGAMTGPLAVEFEPVQGAEFVDLAFRPDAVDAVAYLRFRKVELLVNTSAAASAESRR